MGLHIITLLWQIKTKVVRVATFIEWETENSRDCLTKIHHLRPLSCLLRQHNLISFFELQSSFRFLIIHFLRQFREKFHVLRYFFHFFVLDHLFYMIFPFDLIRAISHGKEDEEWGLRHLFLHNHSANVLMLYDFVNNCVC